MHPYLVVPLLSCVISAMLAAAIMARDPSLRVNRLMGLLMVCTAHWSFCEVMWNTQLEAEAAIFWLRLSSLGWMLLGPVAFHIFVELVADRRRWFHRLVPYNYAAVACGVTLYIATPWCLTGVIQTDWGWAYTTGPLFSLSYSIAATPPVIALLNWRHVSHARSSGGERRVSRAVFASAFFAIGVATVTDVLMPMLGHHVPRFATAAITTLGVIVAWHLNRFGYSLLSPSAFAQEILETLHDGVAVIDSDRKLTQVNHALAQLVGAPEVALLATPLAGILPELAGREDLEARSFETELLARDGQRIPVAISASRVRFEVGGVLGQVLVVCDLREVVALRRRLVTSGRLAAVGELSAGISQEINRPIAEVKERLRALRTNWDGLETKTHSTDRSPEMSQLFADGEEVIDECLEGVERVVALVRDVRGFAYGEGAERVLADLNGLVVDALRLAGPRAGPGVEISKQLDDLSEVSCEPREIVQVILNLLLNAFDSVGPSGHIGVRTEQQDGEVRVCVEDDGCGIPIEVRDRIFDPFFTTKAVGEGTGLGLAISSHIVRRHGGDIRVESIPNQGTVFTLVLPEPRALAP